MASRFLAGFGSTGTWLVPLDQCTDPVGVAGSQVRAPDHRPGADPEVIQTCTDESCDAPLSSLPILHLVASRVPQERRHVVFAIGEVGLRIDRHELIASAKDVVMVKVTMHQPVPERIELGEELAGERNELASVAVRAVERALNLWRNRAERGSRTAPQL